MDCGALPGFNISRYIREIWTKDPLTPTKAIPCSALPPASSVLYRCLWTLALFCIWPLVASTVLLQRLVFLSVLSKQPDQRLTSGSCTRSCSCPSGAFDRSNLPLSLLFLVNLGFKVVIVQSHHSQIDRDTAIVLINDLNEDHCNTGPDLTQYPYFTCSGAFFFDC